MIKPKYYAGALPYHEADRERFEQIIRDAGKDIPIPEPTPAHIPMPCAGCGMALSIGPALQERIANTPNIECICPICLAMEQKRTKQQITVENVEHQERECMVLCSCGIALKPGERCSRCWREAKAYGAN